MSNQKPASMVELSALRPGEEGVFFALLAAKSPGTTRDGKPYYWVTFRDRLREVTFPIWGDSRWAEECHTQWAAGEFYKVQAVYQETNYGPQLNILRIRPVNESDQGDGFDPDMCLPRSQCEPQEMFEELRGLVDEYVTEERLREVVCRLLDDHKDDWLRLPAARSFHHAYLGGLVQHTLSVARNAAFLAEKYAEDEAYGDFAPPLNVGLVVAGAVLHDVGKLRELELSGVAACHTPEGALAGHILQGRDMVREAALVAGLDEETRLRLEHIIVAHQRRPEWGSPKPPMTLEALLVHYADDCDAKFETMATILRTDTTEGPLTSHKNVLRQPVFRGLS